MRTGGETKRKASLPETVGAWLKLWTPPRDVEVPPPPAPRTLAIGGALALVVLAGAAALIVPAIDSSKERAAAADAREAAQRRAESRRRQIAEQRPHRLDAPRCGPPPARPPRSGSPPAPRCSSARSGHQRGRARPRAGRRAAGPPAGDAVRGLPEARPRRRPGARPRDHPRRLRLPRPRARDRLDGDQRRRRARLPVPRGARLRPLLGDWCKTNPVPGEREVPDPRTVIELPPACRAASARSALAGEPDTGAKGPPRWVPATVIGARRDRQGQGDRLRQPEGRRGEDDHHARTSPRRSPRRVTGSCASTWTRRAT